MKMGSLLHRAIIRCFLLFRQVVCISFLSKFTHARERISLFYFYKMHPYSSRLLFSFFNCFFFFSFAWLIFWIFFILFCFDLLFLFLFSFCFAFFSHFSEYCVFIKKKKKKKE